MDNTKQTFSVVIAFVVIIGALMLLDVLLNKDNLFAPAPGISNTNAPAVDDMGTNVNTNAIIVIPSNDSNVNALVASPITPEVLVQGGITNAVMEEGKKGKDLFGLRFDQLMGDIVKQYIYQDNFPLGYIYEPDRSMTYDGLKQMVATNIANSPVWSMNETNSFGQRSFYLNNSNRAETVFVLIEFKTVVLGFEYPKNNHLKFEALVDYLKRTF